MKPAISLITLGTTDIERARKFYQELGWELSSSSNEQVCFFKLNNIALGIWSRASLAEDAYVPNTQPGFGGFSLAMNMPSKAEVDAALQEAEDAGAKILKPAVDVFWGGYSGYFADPDGHVWEVAWNPGWHLKENGTVMLP